MFLATLFKSNFSEHLFLRTSLDDCFGSFKLHNSRGVLNVFSAWRCSVKNVFLKFLQNSQENTGGGRLQHRCLPQNFTIFFKSTYSLGFYDNCPRVKLPPNPKTNPDPNPNPNRGAIFLGGQLSWYHRLERLLLEQLYYYFPYFSLKVFPRASFNGLLTKDINTSCRVYVMF